MNPTTLNALMHANRGAARSITYLEGENESRAVRYGELYERALGILYHLQQLGARPGDRLILLLGANEPFIDAFWAAVLGGIIPVPLAPGISDEHRHKLLRIARQLGAPFLYTEQRLLERLGSFAATHEMGGEFEQLRARTFLVDELDDVSRAGREHEVSASDTAFIQFSSGSTSTPKGVVLSHANLIANIRGATEVARFGPEDVSLSWMPLTHDMGLIGFHLVMFANRVHTHLMPTDLFVRRPLLWLQFASRIRASILCSPNFGYRHYLKILGERAVAELDLSSVRLIFNGAEPISVELCEEFLTRMAPARLKRESMFTVYGLAEASLAVSFPPVGRRYRTLAFNRHQLGVGQAVEVIGPTERNALLLASVGKPIPYCEVRLGDEQDAVLPEGRVGHIQIRGANVTAGYLDAPQTNAESFTSDGWLRTGDLGVFQDGELYVTGRHKEILFVNGQNYYPHDLESLTHDIEGLDLGKVVVAGVRPEHSDSDQIVVFVWYRGDMSGFLPLARQVARRIGEHAGIEISAVVPVKRIPKTTSGKIQRHLLEQEYLSGVFAAELGELAALEAAQPLAAQGHGAIEATLQEFCENALEGRRVGRLDNLFDAGISSLKFMAIHEQIEQRWPGLLDITDLFDHPTVAELAHFIESRQGSGDGA
jgi:acyl-CoA synthetase (AMP-forming)/AMP-acid ligase II/aryl carrier-like protein